MTAMTHHLPRGHEHTGKSSKDFLDVELIRRETGLKKGNILLDIGCGEGFFSIAASQIIGKRGKVYAVDNNKEPIDVLREQITRDNIINIEAIVADVTKKIPMGEQVIDIGLMVNVLHGFFANNEIDGTMREVARVTKNGGILAIVDFKAIEGSHGPHVSIRLSPHETEEWIIPYGFRPCNILDVGQQHYMVIFDKVANKT
jgi:ubiquinone/menaquinone biosynthesis C-methylase UbiE